MGSVDLAIEGYDGAVEIGRGGFGVVYRARQIDLDRSVAIKMLSGTLDESARRRFDRERQAMSALSGHANIVTIYSSGTTAGGQPYIVMEYLPGGSLADRLTTGPIPWQGGVDIAVKLAAALEVAHEAGVLHRDLKPENVLVSAYGEPRLADFGIARVQGATATSSGVITATVAHAAPEILDGAAATREADVYSLASTLYALIAGQPAFVRDSDESLIPVYRRIASESVPDLRPRGVPDHVCVALEAAMAKDPNHRTLRPRDLAVSLTQSGPPLTKPSGPQSLADSTRTVTTSPPAAVDEGRSAGSSRRTRMLSLTGEIGFLDDRSYADLVSEMSAEQCRSLARSLETREERHIWPHVMAAAEAEGADHLWDSAWEAFADRAIALGLRHKEVDRAATVAARAAVALAVEQVIPDEFLDFLVAPWDAVVEGGTWDINE